MATRVLLADGHHGLRDSLRGLLETIFDTVFMVSSEASLLEGIRRLDVDAAVVDLSLSAGDLRGLLGRMREAAPHLRVLLLSVHDERCVGDAAMAAGADAVVLKRCLGTELLPAVAAVLAGRRYVSPGIARGSPPNDAERHMGDAQA